MLENIVIIQRKYKLPFLQSEIFHTSYRNTTELINKRSNLTISSQSVYLYQQTGCRMHLDERKSNYGNE